MLVFFDYAAAAFFLIMAALLLGGLWVAAGNVRLWLTLKKIERDSKREAEEISRLA
jgi:hypothetical protein